MKVIPENIIKSIQNILLNTSNTIAFSIEHLNLKDLYTPLEIEECIVYNIEQCLECDMWRNKEELINESNDTTVCLECRN